MAPTPAALTPLSPAELSYLHSSLSLTPPIRSDSRSATQFRPLVAEPDLLPGTNGSARICFADGTEAIVGVKAEVEKSSAREDGGGEVRWGTGARDDDMGDAGVAGDGGEVGGRGRAEWVELTIEMPGYRDDDALPVFLAAMLNEALLATGQLPDRLWINNRWHWKLYIDILLLSPPSSYPLPLLSLTTHLALLTTRLPRLRSAADEDPLFDDDWAASLHLYPRSRSAGSEPTHRPPVTLLVMAVGANIIFDATREELAVADAVVAVSVVGGAGVGSGDGVGDAKGVRVVGVRTIDPPSRLTPMGVPHKVHSATGGQVGSEEGEMEMESGVWRGVRGGMKRGVVGRVVRMVVERGGVGEEVLAGLEGVDIG